MHSWYDTLGETLAADLADPEQQAVFAYHRDRIAALVGGHPDVPADEITAAGFLHGFMAAGAWFVPEDSVERESMWPTLGGIYLYARDCARGPAGNGEADATVFFVQLVLSLPPQAPPGFGSPEEERERAAARDLVRDAFAGTPDVPITRTALAGFVLGLLYAMPYLPVGDVSGPVSLITAAKSMAVDGL